MLFINIHSNIVIIVTLIVGVVAFIGILLILKNNESNDEYNSVISQKVQEIEKKQNTFSNLNTRVNVLEALQDEQSGDIAALIEHTQEIDNEIVELVTKMDDLIENKKDVKMEADESNHFNI